MMRPGVSFVFLSIPLVCFSAYFVVHGGVSAGDRAPVRGVHTFLTAALTNVGLPLSICLVGWTMWQLLLRGGGLFRGPHTTVRVDLRPHATVSAGTFSLRRNEALAVLRYLTSEPIKNMVICAALRPLRVDIGKTGAAALARIPLRRSAKWSERNEQVAPVILLPAESDATLFSLDVTSLVDQEITVQLTVCATLAMARHFRSSRSTRRRV